MKPVDDQYGDPVQPTTFVEDTPIDTLCMLPITGVELSMLITAALCIIVAGLALKRIGRCE
jgi:hypothetical protein